MKNPNLKLLALFCAVVVFAPLLALPKSGKAASGGVSAAVERLAASDAEALPANTTQKKQNGRVRVYFHREDKVETMPLEDYLYGVIAAECPMSYNREALLAGIIAARSYTLYLADKNAASPYDVSTDPQVCQAYKSADEAKKAWGNSAEKYDKLLRELLKESDGRVVTYDGKPIFAAYHAISSGTTEAAENVWGNEVAYLKPVESVGDKLSKSFLHEQKLTNAEINSKLSVSGLELTAAELLKAELTRTERGNVVEIKSGEETLRATSLVAALGLRSQNFTMSSTENGITFSTRGYGHQVGMSQNGANHMAAGGSTAEEILTHYYSGVKVEKTEY